MFRQLNVTPTIFAVVIMYIQFVLTTDCPDLAILNNPINITANYSERSELSWTRPSDGLFIANCDNLTSSQTSCGPIGGYSAVATNTESQLTINSVGLVDVGPWTLTDTLDVCTLSAAGIPSCNITSTHDTEDLDLDIELTLSIDVDGYYCTRHYNVNISLGDVTEHLFSNTSASDILSHTSTLTFNITKEHFGDVRVIFECEDFSTTLKCSGVERLSRPSISTSIATSSSSTLSPPEATTKATPTTTTTTATTTITGGALEPSDEMDLGLILGITIPLVILVVLIAFLVYRCRNK